MKINNAINRWQKKDYATLTQFLSHHKLTNNMNDTNNLDKNYIEWTKTLNMLMKKEYVKQYVYRGLKMKRVINNEITNYSFIAVSKSLDKASEFGDIIVKFHIPSHIKSYTFENDKEQEILVQRNTKLILDGVESVYKNKPVFTAKLIKYYEKRNIPRTMLNYKKLVLNSENENSNFEL
jgi:hypothetical protein